MSKVENIIAQHMHYRKTTRDLNNKCSNRVFIVIIFIIIVIFDICIHPLGRGAVDEL